MATNLAGKTFEVQTSDGSRWEAVDLHQSRSGALRQAEDLLAAGDCAGVRVLAESERTGTETIFEEMLDDGGGKAIQIMAIEAAAMCGDLDDYYGFESRRTVGRLMREYLDEYGLSALELAFDASHLMMLERNERLFPMAVRRVAGLQAKAAATDTARRTDDIYAAVAAIKAFARETDAADAVAEVIAGKGLAAALEQVNLSVTRKLRARTLRFALARYLNGGGDWNAKLSLLAGLGAEDPGDEARAFLDEALAEILDGAQAVTDLLGGQPDLGTANHALIRLAAGRCPVPKNPISCIEAVNAVLGRLELPLSRRVIHERVAREIGSTRPLTREGRESDRDLFVTVVRDLVEIAGLEGGPPIAAAAVRRARLVLGDGDDDLSVPDAISRVLDLLPHRAVRLGFLLDLAVSDVGADDQMLVFGFVGRIVKQMSSITSFLPPGSSPDMLHATVEALKRRLSAEGLPESWRDGIREALDTVTERGVSATPVTRTYATDEQTQRIIAMTPDHDSFAAGDTLFVEGDAGDQAYLIKSGEVEILRTVGNEEILLARLGRGEIFGEMSLIDNQPRMATARVAADAELAVITRENIEARLGRLAQSDMVIRRLIDVFVTRIRGEARLHE